MGEIKSGTILSYLSIFVNILIGLTYTPFLLRMLGQSEYGIYSLAASTIAYLFLFDLGFGQAIIRYCSSYRTQQRFREMYELLGLFFLLYLGIAFLSLIVGGYLAFNVDVLFKSTMTSVEIHRTRIVMLLMTFNLAFTFPMSIWTSVMASYERFVFIKTLNISRNILNAVVMVILLYWGYKAIALVCVTTILNVVALFINYLYCRGILKVKLYFSNLKMSILKDVSSFSFWVFLNSLMNTLYWNTGQFIIGVFSGPIAVAIYAVAIQLKNMYYLFSTSLSSVLLPRITSMVTEGCTTLELSRLLVKTGRLQFFIISYIFVGFVLFGRPFIILWAGNSYQDAFVICLLFFAVTFIPLIQNVTINILMAKNILRTRSLIILINSICGVLLSIPLTYYYGALGFAISISLFIIIGHGFCLNIYYHNVIGLDMLLFWKEILRISLIPILFLLLGPFIIDRFHFTGFTSLSVAISIFSLLYLPLIYKFAINDYEKSLIYSLLSRVRKKDN